MTAQSTPNEQPTSMTVEEYAVDLAVYGIVKAAEGDLNEDGQIDDKGHHAACDLALDIARAIGANPQVVLDLAASYREAGAL